MLINSPSIGLVYHPKKAYPVLVGKGSSPYSELIVTFLLSVSIWPPCVSNETIIELSVSSILKFVMNMAFKSAVWLNNENY